MIRFVRVHTELIVSSVHSSCTTQSHNYIYGSAADKTPDRQLPVAPVQCMTHRNVGVHTARDIVMQHAPPRRHISQHRLVTPVQQQQHLGVTFRSLGCFELLNQCISVLAELCKS